MSSTLDYVCRYYRQGRPWPTCSLGVDLDALSPSIIDRPCIAPRPDDKRVRPPIVCDKREPMTRSDKDDYMAPFKLAFQKITSGVSPCCDAPTQTVRNTSDSGKWSESVFCSKCKREVMHGHGGPEVP